MESVFISPHHSLVVQKALKQMSEEEWRRGAQPYNWSTADAQQLSVE